eukprot:TRINITY_DN5628_c1_g4_i2.p1 TRINITY_DN5628_c1_g4~~TRINITY_DN5628_c1_g4_i2.p1  ORF type:complete len:271 (-),score=57.57 TRINITY_DN5628_c1_g4_i2:60-872(-)
MGLLALVAWNLAAAGVTATAADLACQRLEYSRRNASISCPTCMPTKEKGDDDDDGQPPPFKVKVGRLLRFIAFPGIPTGIGATIHYYYILPAIVHEGSTTVMLLEVFGHCVYQALRVGPNMLFNNVLVVRDCDFLTDKLRSDWPPCAMWTVAVWLPSYFLIFGVIPTDYRPTVHVLASGVAKVIQSFYFNRGLPDTEAGGDDEGDGGSSGSGSGSEDEKRKASKESKRAMRKRQREWRRRKHPHPGQPCPHARPATTATAEDEDTKQKTL